MKIILCLGLILSFSAFAEQDVKHCLGEAVDSAISLKIDIMAEGDCSNLTRDQYREIEETRQHKRRFLKNALKGLKAGVTIPSSLFTELDDPARVIQLDKTNICGVVEKTSIKASKEIMKDCPEGAELFQWIVGRQQDPEKIADISLAHACERIQNLKAQACKESKYTYSVSFDSKAEKKVAPPVLRAPASSSGSSAQKQ
jgi:hypothetical protein